MAILNSDGIDNSGDINLRRNNAIVATIGNNSYVFGDSRISRDPNGNNSVELGLGNTGNRTSLIDFHSSGDPNTVDFNARISRGGGVDGTLELVNTANGAIDFFTNGTAGLGASAPGGPVGGTTGPVRLRIDPGGRILAGTSSYRSVGDTFTPVGMFYSEGAGTGHYQTFVGVHNRNDAGGPILIFGKSRGTVVGSNTIVANGDQLGGIRFAGANGTNLSARGAEIFCEVDGTPSSTSMPGRLVFRTTPVGTTITTERMRITSAGIINLNTTNGSDISVASGTVDGISFYTPGASSGIFQVSNNNNAVAFFRRRASNGVVLDFRRDSTAVGTITVTTTNTAYNTSSDYRLKENVVDLDGAIDRLKQLPVHRFNFIADPDTVVDGFIAHEAQEIVPECVTGTKDEVKAIGTLTEWNGTVIDTDVPEPEELTWEDSVEVTPAADATYDEEGNELTPAVDAVYETVTRTRTWEQTGERPVYQGIDQAKIVPLLTAALQEAIKRIETLEARVLELEAS
jgi:hypothetical protein